ncbi:MAG: DUF6164 family protein [Xanthomonadales bacterium]|nr:DUF6164 family protein [Xanthomonadales bacterium]
MAQLLLNMYQVPRDEVDAIAALLDAHAIEHYETPPSRWGISFGGLWVTKDDAWPSARKLMNEFQLQRANTAREAHAAELADGSADTFWLQLRREPSRVLWTLLGIIFMLGLVALPIYLLS